MPKKKEVEIKVEVPTGDVCVRCGKPATITSPDGKRFCALSCKSASEIK